MGVQRRHVLRGGLAALAAAGVGRVPAAAAAETAGAGERRKAAGASGLVTGRALPLPFKEIPGVLSARQLAEHHDAHYGGALAAYAELDEVPDRDPATLTTKANSVVLHELYFANLTPEPSGPRAGLRQRLARRFGSFDRWRASFDDIARSATGWAVLALHPVNGRLYNLACAAHAEGHLAQGVPLLALDLYEHSYYLDYASDKGRYVERCLEHLAFGRIALRLQEASAAA